MSYENKVDPVLLDVPSNLSILHIFKPISFIPPWNKRVDDFIESTMFFANRFLFDRKVVIIMRAFDL